MRSPAAGRSQLPVLDALSRRTGRLPERPVSAPSAGGTEGEDVSAETGRCEVRRTRGVLDHADARSAAPTSAAAAGATRSAGATFATEATRQLPGASRGSGTSESP